jgi:hypothetical protein
VISSCCVPVLFSSAGLLCWFSSVGLLCWFSSVGLLLWFLLFAPLFGGAVTCFVFFCWFAVLFFVQMILGVLPSN